MIVHVDFELPGFIVFCLGLLIFILFLWFLLFIYKNYRRKKHFIRLYTYAAYGLYDLALKEAEKCVQNSVVAHVRAKIYEAMKQEEHALLLYAQIFNQKPMKESRALSYEGMLKLVDSPLRQKYLLRAYQLFPSSPMLYPFLKAHNDRAQTLKEIIDYSKSMPDKKIDIDLLKAKITGDYRTAYKSHPYCVEIIKHLDYKTILKAYRGFKHPELLVIILKDVHDPLQRHSMAMKLQQDWRWWKKPVVGEGHAEFLEQLRQQAYR